MSMALRQALERVARRFRRERLWSSLALCWLVWALVGCGMKTAVVSGGCRRRSTNGWLLGSLAGGGTGLGRSSAWPGLAKGARSALGGPPDRGEASRAEDRAAGRGRGDRRRAIGPARLLANRRHPRGARSPPQATTGTKRSRPGRCAGRRLAHAAALVSLARRARHAEPVCAFGCRRREVDRICGRRGRRRGRSGQYRDRARHVAPGRRPISRGRAGRGEPRRREPESARIAPRA